jgi:hypothetical protein
MDNYTERPTEGKPSPWTQPDVERAAERERLAALASELHRAGGMLDIGIILRTDLASLRATGCGDVADTLETLALPTACSCGARLIRRRQVHGWSILAGHVTRPRVAIAGVLCAICAARDHADLLAIEVRRLRAAGIVCEVITR